MTIEEPNKNYEVQISFETRDTLRYSKADFEEIVKNFPNLTAFPPKYPDSAFDPQFVDIPGKDGNAKHLSFGSESGQDNYYLLYSYFLKQKLLNQNLEERRSSLIHIFHNINDIYAQLNFGGTYFGHQYRRVLAYAEYSLFEYTKANLALNFRNNFKREKEAYIRSLKVFILQQLSLEKYFNEGVLNREDKLKMQQDLLSIVQKLDKLITDKFCLLKAREFQTKFYSPLK